MASHSIEVTEAEHPIQLLAYEFVPDKAGAGKYRGGVPFRRDYRFNETEGVLQVRSDRRDHRPFGLYGGSPGQPSENYLNPETENRVLPGKFTMNDQEGRRLPACARRRRRLGRSARARSGCRAQGRAQRAAVRGERPGSTTASSSTPCAGSVDAAATAKRRAAIRAARGWREVPKVQRHDPVPTRPAPRSTS